MTEFKSSPSPLPLKRNEPQFSFASEQFSFGSSSSSSLDIFSRDDYRISPPIDQLYRPNYDLDTKWRSVAVSNQMPGNHFMASAGNQFIVAKENKKGIAMDSSAPTSSQTKLPDYKAPILLMTTHFITCVPISCIITLVERALLHYSEVSFSMVADDCMVSFIFILSIYVL